MCRLIPAVCFLMSAMILSGCAGSDPYNSSGQSDASQVNASDMAEAPSDRLITSERSSTGKEKSMQLKIGGKTVDVDWECNESVETLKTLCENAPLEIKMSMYGGFEQVGSIGKALPRNDNQMTARAGDIVLYSGDRIVIFYGSNSWAYTRLGRITDLSEKELSRLLGNGDITITIDLDD